MRMICVDSDRHCLDATLRMCRRMDALSTAEGFLTAKQALAWTTEHAADIALLEFDVTDMDGIDLVRELRKLQPEMAILFLTSKRERAIDAWEPLPHIQGFLLKPVDQERLEAEINRALSVRIPAPGPRRVEVKCFGGFDLFVDGRSVVFPRSKAKELLACLVDRRGNWVSRLDAFSTLWENRCYDKPAQKYFDNVARCMLDTLEKNGVRQIVEKRRGAFRVRPEMIRCDFYGFLDGDLDLIYAFRGEYMNDYSWASVTEAFVDSVKTRKIEQASIENVEDTHVTF